jgi:HEAT repeat protein
LLAVGGVLALILLFPPTEAEQKLSDLTAEDVERRDHALVWLLDANPNVPERARVASALEGRLASAEPSLNRDRLLRAYLRWAAWENVPWMIGVLDNPSLPFWDTDKTAQVMEALGRMGDDRAIEPLARKLADFSLGTAAFSSLKRIGRKAEKTVLACLFQSNEKACSLARRLLREYGTQPEAITQMALRKLGSNEFEARIGALVWLANCPPANAAERPQTARILIKGLDDFQPGIRAQTLRALKLWATRDCLPRLLTIAERDEAGPFGNRPLIEVLEQFKEEQAAEAIALQMTTSSVRKRVSQALEHIGAPASKAVLKYVNHPDSEAQQEARHLCKVLNISRALQIEQVLADLTQAEAARRRAALKYLSGHLKADEQNRLKLSRALNSVLEDRDNGVREDALHAVKVWGSRENTRTLLRLLEGNAEEKKPFGRSGYIVEILGVLKDPEAAPALARGLANVFERGHVIKALKSMGPGAEKAVIPYLHAEDRAVREEACRILAAIGTRQSLAALKAAAQQFRQDVFFLREVQAATRQISARK